MCLPGLLSLQEFPVGGNLDVQSQFDIHELLVLTHLPGHILLSSLKSILQVLDAELSILHSQLTTLLCLSNLGLQTGTLTMKRTRVKIRIFANNWSPFKTN